MAWTSVKGLMDGDPVDAATLNGPIDDLVARTDWLKDQIDGLGGQKEAVVVRGAALSKKDRPQRGDMVCADPESGEFRKAVASMSLYDAFTASEKAFAVGILVSSYDNGSGDICLYGRIDLSGFDMSAMMERGRAFVSGQYYLSSMEPGKITRFPNGPRILAGYFVANPQAQAPSNGSEAFVNPQHMDIEAHSHRTYRLEARPVGEAEVEYPDGDSSEAGSVKLYGYLPDNAPENAAGIPRLSVCGDWAWWGYESYRITLDCTSCNGGTWPIGASWATLDGTVSGSGEFRFFGDTMAVGKRGMMVRLGPWPGMGDSESSPFSAEVSENPVWTLGRDDGRGWGSAGANLHVQLGDEGVLRVGGVSDRAENHVNVLCPGAIYDLTASIPEILDGNTLAIGDDTYTFKTSPEGGNDIAIIDQGRGTFDTLAQLGMLRNDVAYDEGSGRVFLGAASAKFNGDAIGAAYLNSGSGTPKYGLIFYDGGESLAQGVEIPDAGVELCAVRVDSPYTRIPLLNGLDLMYTANLPSGTTHFDLHCVPGAVFRYNIGFDEDLNLHFPPVPAKSGCLMLNGAEVEATDHYGNPAVIDIGYDSIYWRDGLEGRQPWPIPAMAHDTPVDPEDEYREIFHFVSQFHSETGPVTSLRPAEGSPITVRRCSTIDDATVGDLELGLDLMLAMEDAGIPGYKVPKAARGNKMLLGPVVEKLRAGPGISFSRTEGVPEGQGTFTISADGAQYAGDFETIALENAKLDSIGMFPYVRMLSWNPDSDSNIPTAFVAKFHLPATAADAVYRVRFYASVFGEESFSGGYRYAGVGMEYSVLPDFTMTGGDGVLPTANLRTGLIAPDGPATLDVMLGSEDDGDVSYTAYDPILAHNDPYIGTLAGKAIQVLPYSFPNPDDCKRYIEAHQGELSGAFGIRPGYTVAVRFYRTAPSTGTPYTAPIGFLNLRWSAEEVAMAPAKEYGRDDDIVMTTVRNLRMAAAKARGYDHSYELANILARIVDALK